MAKEADKAKCDKFLDFEKRVYSIKSESVLKAAKAFFGENALRTVPARVLPWNIRSGDTFRVRYDGMSGIHPKFFVIQ